jgi:hypothetical protein
LKTSGVYQILAAPANIPLRQTCLAERGGAHPSARRIQQTLEQAEKKQKEQGPAAAGVPAVSSTEALPSLADTKSVTALLFRRRFTCA